MATSSPLLRRYDLPSSSSSSSSLLKREALEHLASIDLVEMCNEAKVERCRATRDLRSCGRVVQYVLNSCGHASLCAECSQRYDSCPICKTPIPKNGIKHRLRLYYECIEAGLISKQYDDRFQEEDHGEKQLAADVERLHCLFDVSMENNLASLICHYVTDVCMDKSAVSSDPVIAYLLDEVVVKNWCKRTFGRIITDLRRIYILDEGEMKTSLSSLRILSLKLTGISNVLEVLESSIKGTLSAPYDLHSLQENVLKAKQHLEIMIWCLRHQFLQNITSRHLNHASWRSVMSERKAAAIKRSWPDLITSNSSTSIQHNGSTLFIEDALSNLEAEQGYGQEIEKDVDVTTLAKDGSSSFLKSKIAGVTGCYPFESLRAATDILFLCGSSDMVVAKQAIFLYYLFDRHWTMPDAKWRNLLEDFAGAFNITRHSLLESLTFYLLDDHTDEALQEACRLLPEISGPERHPKIAQVLLERQNPDAALMFLRWCGYDGFCAHANSEEGRTHLGTLPVAVTAVRVRVECGLLTEAFTYQRSHCLKVKEEKSKHGSSRVFSNNPNGEGETWLEWMEALVTEVCCLCIRRNLVDRMIELPWNIDEEKYLHKCLLDFAIEDPSSTSGSLLVVYYLQRSRYIEAYQVNLKLKKLEQNLTSKGYNDKVTSKIRSTSQWRSELVEKCIELLPKGQQHQVKTGNCDIDFSPLKEVESLSKSDTAEAQALNSTSILTTLFHLPSKQTSAFPTQSKLSGYVGNSQSEFSNHSPNILNRRFLTPARGVSTPDKDNFLSKQLGIRGNRKVGDFPTTGSPQSSTPPKEVKRSSWKVNHHDNLRDDQMIIPAAGEDHGLVNDSVHPAISGTRLPSSRPWTDTATNNLMDFSWSYTNGNGDSSVNELSKNSRLRWRSDENSDDENDVTPDRFTSGASSVTPMRGSRRSRRSIV